jgi:hypothetical protein
VYPVFRYDTWRLEERVGRQILIAQVIFNLTIGCNPEASWSISNIQYNHPTEYQKWIEMGIEASKIHQNPMKSGPIMPDPDFRSGLQS